MDNQTNTSIFHTIWSAVLTGFFGLIVWDWKRLGDQVNLKADKDVVKEKFDAIQADFREMRQIQKDNHSENTERLDAIFMEVSRRGQHDR